MTDQTSARPGSRCVILTDAEGLTTWVSAAFTAATGWTLDDLRGRTPGSVLQDGGASSSARAAMRDAMAARVGCFGIEIENRRKNGSRYVAAVDLEPRFDDAGVLVGWVGTHGDESARRAGDEETRRLHRWHAAMRHDRSVGIFERNLDTGDAYWDDRLCEISGLPPGTPMQSFEGFVASLWPEDRAAAVAIWQSSLETLKPTTAVYRLVRPDGDLRWLRYDWIVHRSTEGGRVVAGTVRDISGDIAARRAAAIEHAQLLLAADLGQIGLMRVAVPGGTVAANAAALRIFGLPGGGGVTQDDLVARLHPQDRDRATRHFRPALDDPDAASAEEMACRLMQPDGVVRHLIARRSPSVDRATGGSEILHAVIDVTEGVERDAREAHLSRSRAMALDIAGVGVWEAQLTSRNGTSVWESMFDDRLLELYGWAGRPHRYPTEQWFAAIHPDDQGRIGELYAAVERGGQREGRVEFRIQRPDGTMRWLQSNYAALGPVDEPVVHLLGTTLDVTERRRLEMTLRRESDLLRATQRMASVAHWRRVPSTGEVEWSPQLYDIFRRDPALGPPSMQELERYYEPSSWATMMQFVEARCPGDPPIELQVRIVRHDGDRGWVRCWIEVDHDERGQVVERRGCLQDITEILAMRDETRSAHDRLQAVFESALNGLVLTDDAARYVEANPAACAMLGYSRDEMLSMSVQDVYAPDNGEAFHGIWRRYVHSGEQAGRVRLRRKDGRVIVAEYLATANVQPGVHMSVFSDVTARVEAEAALYEAQARLRELTLRQQEDFDALRAELARDVHDELGQTLGALKLELDALERSVPPGPRQRPNTERVRRLLGTAVGQVRDIARALRPPVLDLGLAPALRALGADMSMRSDVDVVVEVPDTWPGSVPRTVDQAVYRIVQEALTNAARHADASEVRVSFAEGADGMVVEVSDNGCGFELEASERAFGLGLLGMRERAHQIGAELRVDSAPGTGTRVHLRLNPATRSTT